MRQVATAWRNRQRGLGKWGWLFFIGVAAFTVTAGLRLGPHYVDFEMVKGVLKRLPADEVHKDLSRAEIYEHFKKQFRVESFRIPVKDVIHIERDRDSTTVAIDYEIREHLFYNVDVVLVFREQRTYQ